MKINEIKHVAVEANLAKKRIETIYGIFENWILRLLRARTS